MISCHSAFHWRGCPSVQLLNFSLVICLMRLHLTIRCNRGMRICAPLNHVATQMWFCSDLWRWLPYLLFTTVGVKPMSSWSWESSYLSNLRGPCSSLCIFHIFVRVGQSLLLETKDFLF